QWPLQHRHGLHLREQPLSQKRVSDAAHRSQRSSLPAQYPEGWPPVPPNRYSVGTYTYEHTETLLLCARERNRQEFRLRISRTVSNTEIANAHQAVHPLSWMLPALPARR